MKTPKKPSITIQIWNGYEFKLFVPEHSNLNTKPYLYFTYTDPTANETKRIKKSKGLNPNSTIKELKSQAKVLSETMISNLQNGWNPIKDTYPIDEVTESGVSPKSTIIDCLTFWLKHREESYQNEALGHTALKNNKYLVAYFTEWLTVKGFQRRMATSFTKIDIEVFLQTYTNKRNWNKVSYNSYRTDLGTFFNFLVALKVLQDNPVKYVDKKNTKNDSSRFKIYEEDELLKVVKLLANDQAFHGLYVASKLVYKYNIRPLEVTRLQVRDVDFDKNLIVLLADKTKNGNEARFSMEADICSLLKTIIGTAPAGHYIFGGRNKPSQYQVCVDFLGQRWRAFRKKYNLPEHLKFYALKHTSNYYDLQDGASFEEIRQRNRHSNLQITTLYVKERLFKNVIRASGSNRF